jgi:hypothetical protein
MVMVVVDPGRQSLCQSGFQCTRMGPPVLLHDISVPISLSLRFRVYASGSVCMSPSA